MLLGLRRSRLKEGKGHPRQWMPRNVKDTTQLVKEKENKVEEVQDLGGAAFPELTTAYPPRQIGQTSKTQNTFPTDGGQRGTEYNYMEADFLEPGYSNHSHILLNSTNQYVQNRRPFRLLNVVMQQDNFKEMVKEVRNLRIEGYAMYSCWKKFHMVAFLSGQLQKEFSSIDQRIQQTR
ncbi:hypothetical protein RND71_014295 [Anisodus tanguticus]|uniref:Uncharacterized protein n=1 Tax=Anisodus tanguticus TaxID=243964 RepID=A0AAE1VNI7_9SOLA|nr:hypothetical protein RND71_014295 [Anisodus tanguticus]